MKYIQGHSMNKNPGRHAENIGVNGGMLFQDPDLSLTTGSFTLFAVACLNDQSEVGRGQFSVLRGCHHAYVESHPEHCNVMSLPTCSLPC